jgi:hypothetical protein
MAAANETEPKIVDEPGAESDQESRLKRYDQRIDDWLGSLKEGAEQRSPEVLSALATKAKDVGDYLEKLAEKARSRKEPVGIADEGRGEPGYRGPDPETDPKGDGDHEDQGT